jgi:hypothetical protein
VRHIPDTRNGYEDPVFKEGGVACERCHGPVENHLARMHKGGGQSGSGILNPANLEPAARDSICAQCHLVGAIRIGKTGSAPYQPGQSLFASTAVLVWSDAEKPLPANSHFEQLSRSACWRKSEDRLWCGTCHDPHATVDISHRASYYRARCLSCHETAAPKCSAPLAAQEREGMNCVGCHMRSKPMVTVQHAVQTDHTISRKPSVNALPDLSSESELVAFPGTSVSGRELGLGYAQQALERNDRAMGRRAVSLLESTLANHHDDTAVGDQLAQLYDRAGKQSEACRLYIQIAEGAHAPVGALINAGTCNAAAQMIEDAIRLWRRALNANPGEEGARSNLALALARTGNIAAARTLLREGLELNPASPRLRDFMSAMER